MSAAERAAAKAVRSWSAAALEAGRRGGAKAVKTAALSAMEGRRAGAVQTRVCRNAPVQTGARPSPAGAEITAGWSPAGWQAPRRWSAARAQASARRTRMPDASAVATMAAGVITATPAVPALWAAPAGPLVPLITAPISARTMPAVVIPTIVFVIEGKVLDLLDRRPALPRTKRFSRPIAHAGLGAARQERKEERERHGGARKQADHCSPSSEEDLASAGGRSCARSAECHAPH
jgi:hypothetical protein